MRRPTRELKIGSVVIGGENPIVVQSMTNTNPRDVETTSLQIAELAQAGCEVVRVAIPDAESAGCLKEIRANSVIPIIADIHFDYRLALMSLEAGADGLRINPGNIGARSRVESVVAAAKERNIPIRIGVNAGSLDKDLLRQFGGATPQAMVESALRQIRVLEELDYNLIKISLKSSDVLSTIKAYRLLSDKVDYPFHLGITEAGTLARGLIKSSLGIGMLLAEGIGDTIRVSLTADPKEEVWAAYEILRAVGSRNRGVELISCPTCGRCEIELQTLAQQVDQELRGIEIPLKVAVMGCVVNGPGEARDAHVGIAGGCGFGLLFKEGKIIERVEKDKMLSKLLETVHQIVHEEGQV